MDMNKLALCGGIWFILTMVHFFVDWIFQTHAEAMVKHNKPKVRLKHCLVYTIGFIPVMFLLNLQLWEIYAGCAILFLSHFIEDTYVPVFLWAKYVRRPPEMTVSGRSTIRRLVRKGRELVPYPRNDKEGFEIFAGTPIGKILVIVVDQIIHILFLLPLVWLAMN